MAAYEVLVESNPYLLVRVTFSDETFDQWLISDETGAELDALLQSYADTYASDWLALPTN